MDRRTRLEAVSSLGRRLINALALDRDSIRTLTSTLDLVLASAADPDYASRLARDVSVGTTMSTEPVCQPG